MLSRLYSVRDFDTADANPEDDAIFLLIRIGPTHCELRQYFELVTLISVILLFANRSFSTSSSCRFF